MKSLEIRTITKCSPGGVLYREALSVPEAENDPHCTEGGKCSEGGRPECPPSAKGPRGSGDTNGGSP